MTINDIIKCINKATRTKDSFYILYKNKIKGIGNYYKFVYRIYLHENQISTIYFEESYVHPIIDGQEEQIMKDIECSFLTAFMTKLFSTKTDINGIE